MAHPLQRLLQGEKEAMIAPQAYTATYRAQGDDRTAGYMPVFGEKKGDEAAHFSGLVDEASKSGESTATADAQEKFSHHFSFIDFIKGIIDIINPLQHIPVISTIYRHITGDEISPMARIAGDALYGGPIGAAVAVANVAVESKTGKDIGENMLAMISPDKPETQVAAAFEGTQVADTSTKITRMQDIVWNTASDTGAENAKLAMLAPPKSSLVKRTEFSDTPGPAPTKLSYRTGLTGNEPAAYSYKEGKVHNLKTGNVPGAGSRPPLGTMNVKPGLHPQEAPAAAGENRSAPPELIAQKMLAGLDQYRAMKSQQIQQGTYAAF